MSKGATQNKSPKYVFKTDNHILQIKSIAQYFQPALSYHLSFEDFSFVFFEWPLKTGLVILHVGRSLHVRRSRIFFKGGPGPTARKQSGQCVFLVFLVQLILQFTERVQWFYYREHYTFPRIQRGSNISRGVQLFPGWGGGVQMLISIKTHITCDFPGEVRTPYPPSGYHMSF